MADNIHDKYRQAGLQSLPEYMRDAVESDTLELSQRNAKPIMFAKMHKKNAANSAFSTDNIIIENSALRNSITDMFFKTSNSFRDMLKMTSAADAVSKSIALKHYTHFATSTNIAMSLNGLTKLSTMVASGRGSVIALDTETFVIKGMEQLPGITELSYVSRNSSTIRRGTKDSMKSVFEGANDTKHSFLFGIGTQEENALMGKINNFRSSGLINHDDRITLERLAKYSDADIRWSDIDNRFVVGKLGEGVGEFATPKSVVEAAESGLRKLTGKASGFERMSEQTLQSGKAHDFMLNMLREVNDPDNLVAIYNNRFDAPLMNNLFRHAMPNMSDIHKRQLISLGGEINAANILDPLEIMNAAYGERVSDLYSKLGVFPKEASGSMRLETIMGALNSHLGVTSVGDHLAEQDNINVLNLLSYRDKDNNLLFNDMASRIKDNLKNAVSGDGILNPDGYNLNQGDLLYFMDGVQRGPLDSFVYKNLNTGTFMEDSHKVVGQKNIIGAKEVMKFEGLYRSNYDEMAKKISQEQQKSLLQAISSGAMKNDFMVGVLKNAYNQNVMVYGKDEWDISRKLQSGLIIGKTDPRANFFSKSNIAIDKTAMSALGATENDIRLRAQGMIGDIDRAQRKYRGWFDMSEGTRGVMNAKKFYGEAKRLASAGVTKEDFFNIAFNEQTVKGIDPQSVFNNIVRYEYNNGTNKEVKYTSSALRDMYHMYDRLASEADFFLPAINKIETQLGLLDSDEKKIKAKAIFSQVNDNYRSMLESNGITDTFSVSKLGYEKNNIVIPRNLFGGDYGSAIEMLREGGAVEDLGVELSVSNPKAAASRVSSLIKQYAKAQGAEYSETFASAQVDKLITHAISEGYLSQEQADKILRVQSSSAFVKSQDLMRTIRDNNVAYETINPEFDLTDFSSDKAQQVSRAISQNKDALLGETDNVINDVVNNLNVAGRSADMTAEFKRQIMESDFISEIANSQPTGEYAKTLLNNKEAAEQVAEELAISMSKIGNKVVSGGKDFAFSIIKDKGEKYNRYYLAMGLAEDVASGKVLGKQKANVALVELGSQTSFQGVNVIMKGGYRQVAAQHLDFYEALRGAAPDLSKTKLYGSYAYSMRQMGISADSISEAILNGNYNLAASRANNKMNSVIGKLTRASFDLYDEDATARINDIMYQNKIYSDVLPVFGDKAFDSLKEANPRQVSISTLNQLLNDRLRKGGGNKHSLAKTIADNKGELDSTNISQAIKIMLGDSRGAKVDAIATEVAKFAKAAGVPEEHVANLFFSVHEGDANKAMSAWGVHPSYFHDYGYMYSNKRPVGRQNLTGRTYFAGQARDMLKSLNSSGIEVGSPISTRMSNLTKDLMSRGSARGAIENSLTGNVLLMSQDGFDHALQAARDSIVNSPLTSASDKAEAETMYRKFQKLNITNQESIIAHEVGSILGDRDVASYNTKDSFQFTTDMANRIKANGSLTVNKGDLIGSQLDGQNVVQQIRAKSTGTIKSVGDGRYILKADAMTNPTMKVGVNGTEKSVGTILGEQETRWLRKHFGDFSVIGNFEVGKHEGYNTLYHDLFTKRFLELKGKGVGESAYEELQKDMAYALTGDYDSKVTNLVKDKDGRVSGIEVSSYNGEDGSYKGSKVRDRVSKERVDWLSSIQNKYAANNKEYYDIKKTLNIGGKNFDAYNLKSSIFGMSIVDDIFEDKGVKFDVRVMESLLRARDKDENQIMQPYIEQLYGAKGNVFHGSGLGGGELERLRKTKQDVDSMSKFLNMYVGGKDASEVGIGNVKEMNSILDMPFYKNTLGNGMSTSYEELQGYMKAGNRMFGDNADFAKIKLHRDVKVDGKTLTELYLPNVNMSQMGDNVYASTKYQRAIKELINSTVDLKKSAMPSSKIGKPKDAEGNYIKAVQGVFGAIKEDFGSKTGALADLFHVRMKNSGISENKELYKPNEMFTAGKSGVEDIVYISDDYAKRLLGDEYHSIAKTMRKQDVMNRLGKAATSETVEDAWGAYGFGLRYPTILESSAKVVKFRIAENEAELGGRQSAIFRHTSYGLNADVDADQLGLVITGKDSMTAEAFNSLKARHEYQTKQNMVAKMLIKDEYEKVYGPTKGSNSVLSFGELMDFYKKGGMGDKTPFVSKLGNEDITAIQGAFAAKVGVGKANIPSFYLRQHATNAYNNGSIEYKDLQLLSAFTETAEQKMIDAIKKENVNGGAKPIDMYFNAMKNNDGEMLQRLVRMQQDDFAGDVLTRYAYHTADVGLAKSILAKDSKAINERYSELNDIVHKVMKDSSYKPQGMELAVAGKLSDDALRQTLQNNIVQIKNSGQDIISRNIGLNSVYQEKSILEETLRKDLKNSRNSDIIEDNVETISSQFRQAMNKAGQSGKDFAGKVSEAFKSQKFKGVGMAFAAMSIGAMALGAATDNSPQPTGRDRSEVGLTADGEGMNTPMVQPTFTRMAPITNSTGPMNGTGLQININASNSGGISDDDIQGLIRRSFGGEMNIKMNFTDDRKEITPDYINNLMMNSLGY